MNEEQRKIIKKLANKAGSIVIGSNSETNRNKVIEFNELKDKAITVGVWERFCRVAGVSIECNGADFAA